MLEQICAWVSLIFSNESNGDESDSRIIYSFSQTFDHFKTPFILNDFITHSLLHVQRSHLTSLSICSRTSLSLKYVFHRLSGFGFRGWRREKSVTWSVTQACLQSSAPCKVRKLTWSSSVTSSRDTPRFALAIPGWMIISLKNWAYRSLTNQIRAH